MTEESSITGFEIFSRISCIQLSPPWNIIHVCICTKSTCAPFVARGSYFLSCVLQSAVEVGRPKDKLVPLTLSKNVLTSPVVCEISQKSDQSAKELAAGNKLQNSKAFLLLL